MLTLLTDEQRYRRFVNIVLDRRGNRVPKLVCSSDDIILTYDTGTKRFDNLYVKNCSAKGNDLAVCAKQWPQIDREGIYKEEIKEMISNLKLAKNLIRSNFSKI